MLSWSQILRRKLKHWTPLWSISAQAEHRIFRCLRSFLHAAPIHPVFISFIARQAAAATGQQTGMQSAFWHSKVIPKSKNWTLTGKA